MPNSALAARTLLWNALAAEAHAWVLRTGDPAQERHWLQWLSHEEQAHCRSLRRNALRHEYLATRALCRAVLSRYADAIPANWKFRPGNHGKPRISEPKKFISLKFNLTHTKNLVICLVTRGREVGIDAEETSRAVDVVQVAKHFFSPAEQASLVKLPKARRKSRFFQQWVLKEAYLKGRGDGLLREPDRFTIQIGKNLQPLPLGNWQLSLHRPGRRHIAATAVRSREPIPIKWMEANRLFKTGVAIV